ncbi:MFS-type transporter SLC18B1-like [Neocloeon triangulifer]|uniref:MFS-type transporter SLC18B1-like n=1 Tax=Neocloeon triangulifer TaxID=2078957 RepID=UPI00286F3AF8|nr:MFS-type transporter SLC18B1-like [Neocloeon triangulifer]
MAPESPDAVDHRTRTKFTRQQWATIVIIGSVHFGSAICISLQAPFYPQEAESKGGTATEYGLVFGIFELTAFLSSPLFGQFLPITGAKRTLNCGIVVAALCSIFFGLLDNFKSHDWFIGLSFAIRIVESLGASAALTAAFAITAAVFPDCVATIFATLEVFYGVGYIAGPTIGGFLFVAGGYVLPFVVMGSVLLLVGVLIYFVLPANVGQETPNSNESTSANTKCGVFSILKIPAVLIDSMCIVSASSSMGFYSALLEPHLRQFNLTEIWMSGMFVLSGAMYAISAPIIGFLCDRNVSPKLLSLIGCAAVFVGCLLVGPAPFFGIKATLTLAIVGLVIHGTGLALMLVSCFIDAIRSAVSGGFNNDLSTYGLISGLWASSFSLGAFVGPSVAGFLFDQVGFENATYYVLGTQLIMFIVMLVFLLFRRRKMRKMQNLLSLVNDESNESSLLIDDVHGKGMHMNILEATEWELPKGYGSISTHPLRGLEVYG